ncbi:MAG: hypothetical protein ACREFZ_07090 [Acetobacteraceae bacterium]
MDLSARGDGDPLRDRPFGRPLHEKGASVGDAVTEAVEDMRAMRGGCIGRITIHAIDNRDHHRAASVNGDGTNHYLLWRARHPRALRSDRSLSRFTRL